MPASERDDGLVLLLRACAFTLGADRPEWGRAMLAELARIDGRQRRWAFALGCIRCLTFTMPASGAQRVVRSGAVVAAIASLLVVAIAFMRYPGVVSGAGTWVAVVIFAAVLLAYVVAAISVGARVVDSRLLLASGLAGALIAASWLAVGLDTTLDGPAALTAALFGMGPLIALSVGWLATAKSGSRRVGVGCTGITALIAGFALFLMWAGWTVTAAGRPYSSGLLRDFRTSGFTDIATYAVNDSLGTGMVLLLLVTLVSGVSGLAGAAAASIKWTEPQA